MIRVALQLSHSKVAVPHRIHEFKDMQGGEQQRHVLDGVSTKLLMRYGERLGGRDIRSEEHRSVSC